MTVKDLEPHHHLAAEQSCHIQTVGAEGNFLISGAKRFKLPDRFTDFLTTEPLTSEA